MTRDEAVVRIRECRVNNPDDGTVLLPETLVEVLSTFGLLKLDLPKSAHDEVIAQLDRKIIGITPTGTPIQTFAHLTREGAAQIVGILAKAGFRITRDPQ